MKIIILTKYGRKGASSRYRFYNYLPYFNKKNIIYEVKPLLSDTYVKNLYSGNKIYTSFEKLFSVLKRFIYLLSISKFDLIIIEKELFPNMPYIIEKLLLNKKKYILDYDDYVGTSYETSHIKKIVLQNKIPKLVKNALLVTVGNRWYFEKFKTPNLMYLPTVVNLDNYKLYNIHAKDNVIVWIGSPSTVKYLKIIESALLRLTKECQFTLKIIGGKLELEKSISVSYIEWNALTENKELAASSVGIMPLDDTLWEKGKCGFKLIQYMASGIPVVGSPQPANKEIINHGESGYIAENEEDWYQYLKLLLLNKSKAKEMGLRGRLRVEQLYSYQVWGEIYADTLIKIAN